MEKKRSKKAQQKLADIQRVQREAEWMFNRTDPKARCSGCHLGWVVGGIVRYCAKLSWAKHLPGSDPTTYIICPFGAILR